MIETEPAGTLVSGSVLAAGAPNSNEAASPRVRGPLGVPPGVEAGTLGSNTDRDEVRVWVADEPSDGVLTVVSGAL